jgi:hypothetical protein
MGDDPNSHASAPSESDIESCPVATRGAGEAGYYKTQSKFVRRDHPFGDDARFRNGLPSLQDILVALQGRYGENALKKFKRLEVDQKEVGHLLQMIGVSSDEPIEWPAKKRRVKAELAGKCRKLAADIERAKWPFGTQMMYSDYSEWSELPCVLRSYANAWEEQFKHHYRSPRTPRNLNVIRLLEYVKSKTRRYHYNEIADLLNATDATYGWEWYNGNERWSLENLRDINYRARENAK